MNILYIVKDGKVINNTQVPASQLRDPPQLYLHDPQGSTQVQYQGESIAVSQVMNGIVMYDVDAPYPNNPSRSPFLHWLNLSSLPGYGNEVSYTGPHPPPDSPPHHYIILKLRGTLAQPFTD